jgi:hypothetical protein
LGTAEAGARLVIAIFVGPAPYPLISIRIVAITTHGIAAKAKAGCPVSKLMKVEIGFGAILLSSVYAEAARRVDRRAARLVLERDEIRLGHIRHW